jgi:hypothetical protein
LAENESASTGRQQLEVLCPHVLWQVQILSNVFRSLPFSVLDFTFTDPGGRELREREKEKKKKWRIGLG